METALKRAIAWQVERGIVRKTSGSQRLHARSGRAAPLSIAFGSEKRIGHATNDRPRGKSP